MQKAVATALLAVGFGVMSSTAAAVDCDTIHELHDFATAGSCTDGDKLYSYLGGTLDAGVPGLDIAFVGGIGSDVHQLFIGGPAIYKGADLNANYTFNYTIEVLDPTRTITSVDLDSTVGNVNGTTRTTTVTKDVYDENGLLIGTLVSLNGIPAGTLPTDHSFLEIRETFSKTGLAILNSAQNSFNQTEHNNTPEPGTLALMGLGLLGLAIVRRRRS